jgi:hypothetical protein
MLTPRDHRELAARCLLLAKAMLSAYQRDRKQAGRTPGGRFEENYLAPLDRKAIAHRPDSNLRPLFPSLRRQRW